MGFGASGFKNESAIRRRDEKHATGQKSIAAKNKWNVSPSMHQSGGRFKSVLVRKAGNTKACSAPPAATEDKAVKANFLRKEVPRLVTVILLPQ